MPKSDSRRIQGRMEENKMMTEEELMRLIIEIEKANIEKAREEMEEAQAWNQG